MVFLCQNVITSSVKNGFHLSESLIEGVTRPHIITNFWSAYTTLWSGSIANIMEHFDWTCAHLRLYCPWLEFRVTECTFYAIGIENKSPISISHPRDKHVTYNSELPTRLEFQ